MSYQSEVAANAVAARHCPPGWGTRVWENTGWHVSWEKGPVAVFESCRGGFHAMVSPHPDECGTGGPWTRSDTAIYTTVEEAAAGAVRIFLKYIGREMRVRDAIVEALPDLPGVSEIDLLLCAAGPDDWITQKELAEFFGFSQGTASIMADQGELEAYEHKVPMAGRRKYSRALIARALERCYRKAYERQDQLREEAGAGIPDDG